MKTATTIELSPGELREMISEEVRKAMTEVRPDKLLTREEAAALIRKSIETIKRMEKRGLIRRVDVAGHPRYRESDVINWKKI